MLTDFEQLLNTIGQYVVLAYIAIWLIYIFTFRRLDSSVVTLTCVMIFSMIMNELTPYLYEFATNHKGVISKAVWHLSFVAFNLIAMAVIRGTHQKFKLHTNKLTLLAILFFAIQSGIQLIRLAEKVFFETNVLSKMYTLGITSVNIMFVFLGVFSIFNALRDRKAFAKDI